MAVHELAQLARVVLSVSIDLGHVVVAVLTGVDEAGLNRSADPEVEGKAKHLSAAPLAQIRRVVGGAVIDHQQIELRSTLAELFHDVCHRRGLVVGRDHGEIGARLRHMS